MIAALQAKALHKDRQRQVAEAHQLAARNQAGGGAKPDTLGPDEEVAKIEKRARTSGGSLSGDNRRKDSVSPNTVVDFDPVDLSASEHYATPDVLENQNGKF